jgi:ATP-dependent Clp protease ATP-binding subunit ClpA
MIFTVSCTTRTRITARKPTTNMKTRQEIFYEHIASTGKTIAESDWCLDLLTRRDVEFLDAIEALQKELTDAPIVIGEGVDVTEVPDGLAAEFRGMKKGWNAALEQLKAKLHV